MIRNLFALLFIFVFASDLSYASHGVGADLSYQSLGGNNYRFNFVFYRDCSGISVNQTYPIKGSSSCGADFTIIVSLDSTVEVSQLCSTDSSRCVNAGSIHMGIQANYYHCDKLLPYACSDWKFGLTPICNRNPAITSLTPNGSTYCLYIEATLNTVDFPTNNSPVFAALPLFHLCNQVQYLHMFAHDPDGDSLAFEMYTPHSDATMDVQYQSPMSGTQPVTFATAADSTRFDPLTGDIRFKADGAQVTVVGVRVKEFRNGILVGSVERDIQVIFDNCTYHAPTASGINGSTSFTSHICVDSLLSFQINTIDLDSDIIHFTWIDSIPGSVITIQGGGAHTATFTWQPPDSSFVRSSPYTFILSVTDSTCPYVYFNSYLFSIYVDNCYAITGNADVENEIGSFAASYSVLSHSIRFKYLLYKSEETSVTFYDVTGRKVKEVKMAQTKSAEQEIDAVSIAAGLYIVNIKTAGGFSKSVPVVVE